MQSSLCLNEPATYSLGSRPDYIKPGMSAVPRHQIISHEKTVTEKPRVFDISLSSQAIGSSVFVSKLEGKLLTALAAIYGDVVLSSGGYRGEKIRVFEPLEEPSKAYRDEQNSIDSLEAPVTEESALLPGVEYPLTPAAVPAKIEFSLQAKIKWISNEPQGLALSDAEWDSLLLDDEDNE